MQHKSNSLDYVYQSLNHLLTVTWHANSHSQIYAETKLWVCLAISTFYIKRSYTNSTNITHIQLNTAKSQLVTERYRAETLDLPNGSHLLYRPSIDSAPKKHQSLMKLPFHGYRGSIGLFASAKRDPQLRAWITCRKIITQLQKFYQVKILQIKYCLLVQFCFPFTDHPITEHHHWVVFVPGRNI